MLLPKPPAQQARAVFMVRPASFASNPQTEATNAFQKPSTVDRTVARRVLAEFDGVVAALDRAGIEVHVGEDSADPPKPDACFPNNWVSFHRDGSVVLYPMLALNRRKERRPELLESLTLRSNFRIRRTVDLTHWEQRDAFLEGTGSLVLDRVQRVAYACLSPRTMFGPLEEFAAQLGYELVAFNAIDQNGLPIYHTNVMMSVGRDFAVACLDALPARDQRDAVRARLEATGHEVLPLARGQIVEFAGNLLALESHRGVPLVALSARAHDALTSQQLRFIERHAGMVCCDVATIERLGGGSVRCMLAEVFLPSR